MRINNDRVGSRSAAADMSRESPLTLGARYAYHLAAFIPAPQAAHAFS